MKRLDRGSALVAGLVLLLVAVASAPVLASHYRLSPGFSLVTEPERKALKSEGVRTTSALLKATGKRKARRALSKATGVSFARLTELATQCDLLRIKGLGPTAVRLLQAARVKRLDKFRHRRLRLHSLSSALAHSAISFVSSTAAGR